jgi:F0F1-type ATP synthase assembly protein I
MLRCEQEQPPIGAETRGGWGAMIRGTLVVQICVLLVLAVAALLLGSGAHAAACVAGGAAIAVPNTVVALSLWLKASISGPISAASLLLGEGLKLALIVLALYATVRAFGPELEWLGLIAGVIGALKAQWLALWFTRYS